MNSRAGGLEMVAPSCLSRASSLLPPATCHLPPCRGRPMAWPRIAAVQCGQAGKNARGREGLQAGTHLGYSGSSTVRTGQHAGKYMGYVRWLQAWKKNGSAAEHEGRARATWEFPRRGARDVPRASTPPHRGPRRAPLACSRCPGRPVSGGRCGGRSSGGEVATVGRPLAPPSPLFTACLAPAQWLKEWPDAASRIPTSRRTGHD